MERCSNMDGFRTSSERYVLIITEHQLKKLLYDKIGLDQKKIQKHTSRAILVRKSLKKTPLKKSPYLEKTTD